jgi:2-keto-3-deoxy-L-rhamnonate aldolase RhmA/quercetin dioxygenase-like cupin family protein
MKTAAVQLFRRKLAADTPVFGLLITLESPSITEMAVALGLDWVLIDTEHGCLDWKEVVGHLRATARSDTVALVRIPELNNAAIKRALDLGADGVVIPWIESAEQLRQAVRFAYYPPEGVRGIGADRATGWGQCLAEHTAEANDHVLVIPIIETVRTAAEVPAMCQVKEAEVFLFGPADFSASAGFRGQWQGPGVAEKILALKDTLRQSGKHCAVLAKSAEDLHQRLGQGFRMLGLGQDSGLLLRSLRATLAAAGRDQPMRASLTAVGGEFPLARLERPPESMRPDRGEVMNTVGSRPRMEIEHGVFFDALVGEHNSARNLTTGLVTFATGSRLPGHTHPFSESITLLRGRLTVAVEGRTYELGPLDNIVIPSGTVHEAMNLSAAEEAQIHIAMATHHPTRTLVDTPCPSRMMPVGFPGLPGGERVNRFLGAPRGSAGPHTEFIDFFNRDLLPGIEMSGGYGLFYPGGRLPAHLHDFDESICIISGVATCVVEGRHYPLRNGATALVPRGRVHYFINDSTDPMAMLWVYAGPTPERIVVDERCATKEGSPWPPG